MTIQIPATDLVILAGGQARRMNGMNKLLQQFDDQIQLSKICQKFKSEVQSIWVNSHRDSSIYKQIEPNIYCYPDDQTGFLGPLMGMKSAWSYLQSDYALFIPCDVTYIPNQVLIKLHRALQKKLSLRDCFKQLHAQSTSFKKQSLFCHSINSLDELQQYKQMKAFHQMFTAH